MKLTAPIIDFDAAAQAIHFKVTDFDLQKSGDAGLLGRLLEMTMNVTRANLPITMRVKVASFASLAQPYVNDLRLDEIVIEDGRVRIVRVSWLSHHFNADA